MVHHFRKIEGCLEVIPGYTQIRLLALSHKPKKGEKMHEMHENIKVTFHHFRKMGGALMARIVFIIGTSFHLPKIS